MAKFESDLEYATDFQPVAIPFKKLYDFEKKNLKKNQLPCRIVEYKVILKQLLKFHDCSDFGLLDFR